MAAVRVRFAPSPTGFLHLGSVRTALMNFLFARKNGGQFILRIEDTDQERVVPGALEAIQTDLEWLKLRPDESPSYGGPFGPYVQSKRTEIYRGKAYQLLESGHAYRCFCSKMRMELIRKEAEKNREHPKYDNRCRSLSPSEIQKHLDGGTPHVLRLKLTPGLLNFNDLIYGPQSMDITLAESDPIILKSDGYPTYHLANVVDDHEMQISHVLRGVEWLNSTPKHLMLYEAFGWKPSVFAHLPLIYNSDGTKLSKRNDDIQVRNMRQMGFLPETISGFLIQMVKRNINFDEVIETNKIMTIDEMVDHFNFDDVSMSSSHFSSVKLKSYNHRVYNHFVDHKREDVLKDLRQLIQENLGINSCDQFTDEYLNYILDWSKTRVNFLRELVDEYSFVWSQPKLTWDPHVVQKDFKQPLDQIIDSIIEIMEKTTVENVADDIKKYSEKESIKYSRIFHVLRMSVMNSKKGPPVAEILQLLGNKRCIQYLMCAKDYVTRYDVT